MSGVGAGWPPPPFGCGAGPAAFGAGRADTSSPSAASTAMGVLTATLSVSSGTRILASTPSSMASTSMVALSVSISASTSPGLTLSPSLFSHFASLPCSMVGERAGIKMSVAMGCSLFVLVKSRLERSGGPGSWWIKRYSGQEVRERALRRAPDDGGCSRPRFDEDVGPQLRRVRLRVVRRELGSVVDDLAHLAVDLLQLVFRELPLLDQPAADLLDRIVLLAHARDLVLGAVLRRVGHGMAPVAVRLHLEDVRTPPGAAVLHGAAARLAYRAHIHAIDLLARDVERDAALGEVGLRRGPAHRRAHGVAVVLDDVDHGELPKLRHVEAFVNLALVGGAIAEVRQ